MMTIKTLDERIATNETSIKQYDQAFNRLTKKDVFHRCLSNDYFCSLKSIRRLIRRTTFMTD